MLQENHYVEFKRALNDKFEKEIVAFLNSRDGGALYLGIEDTGRIVGIDNVDETQLMVASRLRDRIVPSVMGLYEISVETIDSKHVICVRVASGPLKPYYIRDKGMSPAGCYVRVGSASLPMEQSMIETLFSRRSLVGLGCIPSPRQDLSFRQLKIYYEDKHHSLNDRFEITLELKNEDGKYNYLAYLLADENGNSLRVARYHGTDKCELINNVDYGYCSVIQSVYRILDRMLVENRTFCKITSTTRIEKSMIDPIALREVVINAIVHNDYSHGYTPTFEFFSDRLEITSFGGLQVGQTEADMFSGASMPRNRELMRVFRDLDLVEQLGSGMSRILKAYGRDIYQIHDSYIRVLLPYNLDALNDAETLNDNQNVVINGSDVPDLAQIVPNSAQNVIINGSDVPNLEQDVVISGENVVINDENVVINSEDIINILNLLKASGQLSSSEIAEHIHKSQRQVQRILANLKASGKIVRIGANKNGFWKVIKT